MSTSVNTAARVFRLPDLGEGLTEAGLVQWLVAVGDTIATDQAIAEVETAKSVVELPSPFAGVVVALHGTPGDTIDVGAPVLEVADPDAAAAHSPSGSSADASFGSSADASSRSATGASSDSAAGASSDSAAGAASESAAGASSRSAAGASSRGPADGTAAEAVGGPTEHEAYRQEERAGSGNVLIGYGTSAANTKGRRRPRATPAVSTSAAPRLLHATARRPVAVRSPLVRRLARDLGLDVHAITPTGADGAITRADVLRAAVDLGLDGATSAATHRTKPTSSSDGAIVPGTNRTASSDSASASGTSPSSSAATAPGTDELDGLAVRSRERLSPLRRAVSAKLARSRSEIPEATVWVDVDATALWELRAQMAPEGGKAPSITALLARFVLLALEEYPVLASRLSDDAAELISFEGVNLGVAADTERGLLVPVLPRAHTLSVEQLDAALRELAATARAGTMPPERLRGSTFTLNNYGGLGVDGSAAIINHPDVAILGIGRILERPWVVDGAIVARRIAQLSLVFDHRVCDGGYAAGFLRCVTELIEHPLRAFGRV